MEQMGLTLPFEPMNMELNRILESTNRDSSDMPFYISKILQKSFIEIEEKGTEAVACNIPTMKLGSVKTPPRPPSRSEARFVVDHPFMFMIREDYSRTVFYIGVVLNPYA
uniref:serpin-Z1-like n=1 Tax=Erigeron canadensis TaxID=72917 RepID=UPI001CB92738|nr:serpin-Z1-like [Erigeron canadensis]